MQAWIRPVIPIVGVAILMFLLPVPQSAVAGKSYVIDAYDPSVASVCASLHGSWVASLLDCTINSNLNLNSTDSLIVNSNAAIIVPVGVKVTSAGKITIYGGAGIGGLINNGTYANLGETRIYHGPVTNYGVLVNSGDLLVYPGYSLVNFKTMNNTGSVYNSGTISNSGMISNSGSITNSCAPCGPQAGTIDNNGIIANSGLIANPCDGIVKNSGTISGNAVADVCPSHSTTSTSTASSTSTTSRTTATSSTLAPFPTSSSISSTAVSSSATQTATSSSTTTQATSAGSGGIPELPYQLLGAGALAFVVVLSHLIARRQTTRQ